MRAVPGGGGGRAGDPYGAPPAGGTGRGSPRRGTAGQGDGVPVGSGLSDGAGDVADGDADSFSWVVADGRA